MISGDYTYNYMKFEGGVHRVQRIPKTEKGGRVHTSTVTVAVLPQPKDVRSKIPLLYMFYMSNVSIVFTICLRVATAYLVLEHSGDTDRSLFCFVVMW